MKKFCFLILSVFMVGAVSAQTSKTSVSGTVVDETGAPMIGATITVPGTSLGEATDASGNFVLNVTPGTERVVVSFIGYKDVVVDIAKGKSTKLGTITLVTDSKMLDDVVVTQSIAVQRKTPVAVASVDFDYIEEKLGGQEFPEVLKSTPGVYATKGGGGYGDSRINMRGFESSNIAVMINGVPINDMEWGGVYWSNWAGLAEVTRSMQTQRGLGASKVSAPSVGGTINIVTKSLDAKAGGSFAYGIGNDGANQMTFTISSGVTENGWAVTVLGGHKWGNGYIQGTEYNGWNYFVNVSKRIGANHQLSLTAFGAPQEHWQRNKYDGLTIEGWQRMKQYMGDDKSPYLYNATYGFDKNGQRRTSAFNKYHKPQISLNHQWQINDHSSLSSVIYASIASGYGYGGDGTSEYSGSWYGSNNGVLNMQFRKADGTFDYGAIQELNAASATGSQMVMAKSINDHQWYGMLSTYTNQLTDNLELSAGIDLRYYVGEHTKIITDLYDGAYYIDRYRQNVQARYNSAANDPEWVYKKLGVGDNIYRDYDGNVLQEGLFAQLEYSSPRWTAFVSGSLSNTGYWRYDRFYYDADHARSETVNFLGGTIKGGVNFNIDRYNNVFANIGYISRAPFFSGGAFLNSTISNATNPDAVNEKIFSAEIGYGFKSPKFALNLNAYYTMWMDKTMTASGKDYQYELDGATVTDRPKINLQGVDARHMGIELDFVARPAKWLDINGMLSWGDWQWNSNATGFWYNEAGQPMADTKGTIATATGVTEWTPEIGDLYGVTQDKFKPHAVTKVNLKGVKVGDSAQTTALIGATFKPLKGMRIGLDWSVFARNYANYAISNPSMNDTANYKTPWEIPWGNQFDFNISYGFKVGSCRATVYGNINNLFDQEYITDAYDGATHDWDSAYRVFYAFGRTFTVRLKLNF